MSIPKVKVPLTLDRERTLVFSFNALCDVERAVGYNPFKDTADDVDLGSPTMLRAFLWAGLLHEDPDLKLHEAGDLLDATPGGFTTALVAVAQALEAAMPDVVEAAQDGGGAEGNVPGSQ